MNRIVRLSCSLLALCVAAACHNAAPLAAGTIRAKAFLVDTLGKEVGQVTFTEVPGVAGVTVAIEISRGATTGQHGIHVHTTGQCAASDGFASAGAHYNPLGKKHGLFAADGPHAGDLEALTIDSNGHATFGAMTARFTLSAGPNSLLDEDGSAVVLHALPDDQRSDPAGNSGARIACGVIVRG